MSKLLTPSIVRMTGSLEERAGTLNVIGCRRIHIDMSVNSSIPDFFRCGMFGYAERNLFNASVDFHVFGQGSYDEYKTIPVRRSDRVIFHVFSETRLDALVGLFRYFKRDEIDIGISLDLGVPVDILLPMLMNLDLVLVMGIEAGGYGLPLSQTALCTMAILRREMTQQNRSMHMGIDGGVNTGTFELLAKSCDFMVVGGLLFNAPDIALQWRSLSRWLKEVESAD